MAKEKKVDLRKEAETKMEEANARLGEIKQMIVEHQGYMKGLEACANDCEVK